MRKFGTIIADPPWPFQNQATRAATSNHYRDMSVEDLMEHLKRERIPVADGAHLYLWTTGGHLVDRSAAEVAIAWGFKPKYLLTWVKTSDVTTIVCGGKVLHNVDSFERLKLTLGLGNWYRRNAEHVLFAVRGKAPARSHRLPDTFFARRGEHSEKPPVVHELAELMSPGPRLELFARRQRTGWTCQGDQLKEHYRAVGRGIYVPG